MPICPLCHFTHTEHYHRDRKRSYRQCQRCALVFVEGKYLPSKSTELNEYQLHQNDLKDSGYRTFLSRLSAPLLAKLAPASVGLDYGCGPAPLLAAMLEEHGHQMHLYDPFFHANADWQTKTFDFICCSEAIEHFHRPSREWKLWMDSLNHLGWLAIMTKRVINAEKFATWHYKNDQTHVSFFSEQTFCWLASQFHMKVEFCSADVVLLQKQRQ